MNDRYLFRGKSPDSGWIHGFLCPPTYPGYIGKSWYIAVENDYKYGYDGKLWCYEAIDPATIGQCTGLRDKNGTLIFEGDICQYSDLSSTHKYFVDWDRYQFRFSSGRTGNGMFPINHLISEIIGNIYDNPELLEVETE